MDMKDSIHHFSPRVALIYPWDLFNAALSPTALQLSLVFDWVDWEFTWTGFHFDL
jgi:hypothetical protein